VAHNQYSTTATRGPRLDHVDSAPLGAIDRFNHSRLYGEINSDNTDLTPTEHGAAW
jgi:hypothetical protein